MKKIAKTLTLSVAMAMVLASMPITALADGSYYIDSSYLTLQPGETGYITITADQASGRVDWVGSGSISASGSAWLDNGQATIEVTADGPGTGTIQITPVDIATYDGEEISYGYDVQVDVVGDTAEAAPASEEPEQTETTAAEAETTTAAETETTTAAETETTTAAETTTDATVEVLTDGNNDYENLSEEERMYTTVNEQQLYIIRYPRLLDDEGNEIWNSEVNGLDVLNGFELTTVNYKGVDVDCYRYQDILQVFVLKNLETDECGYYTLGENGFEKLNYVTANGKQYIVIDLASSFEVPQGYQLVELTLGNNTVKALKRTSLELKGYEVQINPGLETTDPSGDIYYIYCLVDGVKQLYSYDSGEGTLQRATAVVYNEVETEPETTVAAQPEEETVAPVEEVAVEEVIGIGILDNVCTKLGLAKLAKQTKIISLAVAFALVVAIVLLIIFIILLAASHGKNRKLERKLRDSYNRSKPRNNGKSKKKNPAQKNDDDDDEFFSYVKTSDTKKQNDDDDEFDLKDLK